MPFAMKYYQDLNALKITQNGKNAPKVYAKFMNFLETIKEFHQEDEFNWYIPAYHLDNYLNEFGWTTAMTQTASSIRGNEEIILPNIDYETKHTSSMKLSPFPFQDIGIKFLLANKRAIVGDTMGLGKTVQGLGAIYELIKEGEIDRAIVISPSAVKYQWADEVDKFTDLTCKVMDGTKKKRHKIYEEFNNGEFQLLIVNYELVREDIDTIETLPVNCICIDEAHRLKNRASITFKAIMRLLPDYRFALTGTPMQNKPEEMFALMQWIDKDCLGGITNFKKNHVIIGEAFGKKFVELGYKNLDDIRNKTAPYLIRRLKEEVAKDLPVILESYTYCEMDKNQARLYQAVTDDKLLLQQQVKEIYETHPDAHKEDFKCAEEDRLLGFQYMEQAISDHPHLLLEGSSSLAKKYLPLIQKCKKSPKMEELIDIVGQFIESGSKVVVFTQYAKMLKMIKARMEKQYKQEPYVIHGEIPALERQEQLKAFREKSDRQIMLLTDAGNYGLNIQFADVLINFELPWNPAVTQQRIGRIHRIGSTFKTVNVIHLITSKTIDEVVRNTNYKKTELNEGLTEKNFSEKAFMKELLENYN